MIRGNPVTKTIIVLISLILLVNISYAKETSNNVTEKNKTAIENTASNQNNTPPENTLATDVSKSTAQSTLENHTEIGASNYVQMLFGLFAIVAFIFGDTKSQSL